MMKKLGLLLLFIIGTQCSFAQQADRIQRGQRGYVPPPKYSKGTYVELRDVDTELRIILSRCDAAFGLDDFQKEILKNIIRKNVDAENAIIEDKGNSREVRRKKIIDLNNQYLVELGTILTADQVEEYKVMDFTETKEDRKEQKKKKKNRKNKKGES